MPKVCPRCGLTANTASRTCPRCKGQMIGRHVSPNYPSRGTPMATPGGFTGPTPAVGATGATGPAFARPMHTHFAAPEFAAPEPELVATPVHGFRVWQVKLPQDRVFTHTQIAEMEKDMQEGRNPFRAMLSPVLSGVGVNQDWQPGPFVEAFCHRSGVHSGRSEHSAPNWHCHCGFWAFKNQDAMYEKLASYVGGALPFAYGEVELWGRIVEASKGYRAQFAHPTHIYLIGGDNLMAARMAEAYETPVTPISDCPDEVRMIILKHWRAGQPGPSPRHNVAHGPIGATGPAGPPPGPATPPAPNPALVLTGPARITMIAKQMSKMERAFTKMVIAAATLTAAFNAFLVAYERDWDSILVCGFAVAVMAVLVGVNVHKLIEDRRIRDGP